MLDFTLAPDQMEGFSGIGIEKEIEYVRIARHRVAAVGVVQKGEVENA